MNNARNREPDTPIMIERPNQLRERIGGSLDSTFADKAEAAVAALAGEFPRWLEETVERLNEVRKAPGEAPITSANSHSLYTCALETKSLGETYGYPLVSRFAQSLSRLLVRLPEGKTAPATLIDAHIDAIKAALRSEMTSAQDPVGTRLAAELEQQVTQFLKQPAA